MLELILSIALAILIALAPIVAEVLNFREAIATKASRERLQGWLRSDRHDHLYRRYVGGGRWRGSPRCLSRDRLKKRRRPPRA